MYKKEYPHPEDYLDVLKKDDPVTLGELIEVCSQIIKFNEESNESIYKVIDGLQDFALKLYEESEYRRMRSMAFVLYMVGYTDGSKLHPIYDEFCKEYDKLNRKD